MGVRSLTPAPASWTPHSEGGRCTSVSTEGKCCGKDERVQYHSISKVGLEAFPNPPLPSSRTNA